MGIPIIFDKPFKTYDEQIAHLRDNYGLEIVDEELAKYILSTFSYREGIDFVLDPLGAPIKPDLFEHIDGLRSCDKQYIEHFKKQQ